MEKSVPTAPIASNQNRTENKYAPPLCGGGEGEGEGEGEGGGEGGGGDGGGGGGAGCTSC